jgi:hypothetical protein
VEHVGRIERKVYIKKGKRNVGRIKYRWIDDNIF